MRVIRRLLLLALLGVGVGLAALRVASVRSGHAPRRTTDAEPLRKAGDGPVPAAPATVTALTRESAAPVDGLCPRGFPVKVKESSGIFHVPGGRFYERTSPDRCYATPAAAEADGYRPAKV